MNENQTNAISEFMEYLKEKRHHNLVEMLQTMSRIPCREPKTFENFDFKRINGKNVDALKTYHALLSMKLEDAYLIKKIQECFSM